MGRRTRYHVWPAPTSTPWSTSTMFCVSSLVRVSSMATVCAFGFGCARTTARCRTTAQRATFWSVSAYVRGYTCTVYARRGADTATLSTSVEALKRSLKSPTWSGSHVNVAFAVLPSVHVRTDRAGTWAAEMCTTADGVFVEAASVMLRCPPTATLKRAAPAAVGADQL